MDNTNLDQTLLNLNKIIKDLAEAASRPVSQEITEFVEFRAKKGESNVGRGIIWTYDGKTKQIVLHDNGKFFVSENVDLATDKALMIGGAKVLDINTLGPSIQKSNLRELGRLKGLVVDGSVSINQNLYYNSSLNRLGLGTNEPNAAIGILENGVELVIGVGDNLKAKLGTYGNNDLDIVTDETARISIKANGNIDLGNPNKNPISVKVHGKLSVGVTTPDPGVDLHIAGSARINNKLHQSSSAPPISGNFNVGDITWNDNPKVGGCIGWVCLQSGSPGRWYPFGEIKEQNK
jgi:hypothetical protein